MSASAEARGFAEREMRQLSTPWVEDLIGDDPYTLPHDAALGQPWLAATAVGRSTPRRRRAVKMMAHRRRGVTDSVVTPVGTRSDPG